ncbi:hypothetical protein Tco_1152674 [Tanacetum coccineum]
MAFLLAEDKFLKIKQAIEEEQNQPEDIQELMLKLLNDLKICDGILLKQEEQAVQEEQEEQTSQKSDEVIKSSVENLIPILRESEGVSDDTCDVPSCDNSPPLDVLKDHFEIFSDSNDDCTSSDNDSFKNIDYVEASLPEDSLIMGNEELSTIPEKESDEFIKSSVEDLVPIPSESEDTSRSDSESVLPSCDDFSPIFKEKSVTFSNPLFNSNDDFTSSDDESLSDKDVPEEDVKIYSNLLFEFDDEYISSDINPLFDEVLEDIECKDSYDSNLDESTFLVTPLSDLNEDECVDPGDDIDEMDAFLDFTDIEDSYHDSKGDIHYLESFLSDNITLTLPPKVFLGHDSRSLSNNLKIMVKVFDPGIHEKKISPTYESLTFEDRHYLSFTYVIRTFLPYFTYPVVSPFPLSSGSEDIIFDPGISAFHFSSLEPVAFKCPMEVCSSSCFIPNFTMIWGESS